MPEIIEKTVRECAFEGLSSIDGKELERSANLTSPGQFALVAEGLILKKFHSRYGPERYEQFLRLTLSYNARYREDMDRLGSAPTFVNGRQNGPPEWE